MAFGQWSQNEYKVMNAVTDYINSNKDIPLSAFPSPLIDIATQIIVRDSGKETAKEFLETMIGLLDQVEENNKKVDARLDNPAGVAIPTIVKDNE